MSHKHLFTLVSLIVQRNGTSLDTNIECIYTTKTILLQKQSVLTNFNVLWRDKRYLEITNNTSQKFFWPFLPYTSFDSTLRLYFTAGVYFTLAITTVLRSATIIIIDFTLNRITIHLISKLILDTFMLKSKAVQFNA
jgi:hypothetical protein